MVEILIVSILDGHDTKEYDPNIPDQLKKIKKLFKDKLKAGFRAFALTKDGQSHPIKIFDEAAERIVMTASKIAMFQPNRGG